MCWTGNPVCEVSAVGEEVRDGAGKLGGPGQGHLEGRGRGPKEARL